MRIPLSLFAVCGAAIIAVWWWLGTPVQMPPSPLNTGEKLYCISYAPFRSGQSPLDAATPVEPWQIEDDLARLAQVTNCVRTYSTDFGLEQVPEVARRHGLKVIQGLWLSSHADKNRLQIETAVDLAKRYPDVISAIVVGNEVLLRGEMSAADLANTIRAVKSRVSTRVTYADVWEFWLRHREIYDAVDFITIHILPYWEDFPIPAREAAAHVEAIRKKVTAAFPNKEILIGETGWPSAGRMREGALPSPVNQARVIHDVLTAAKRENYHVNIIEAFDQPWKRYLEGTVGGHWGLFDADSREFKFAWGGAVSHHPYWQGQAACGLALALFTFAAAFVAGGRMRRQSLRTWLWVAAVAFVPGLFIGWMIENVWIESLGVGGWLRSLVLVAAAMAAPLVAAAALASGIPIPAFARVLARTEDRPRDFLTLALGGVLILIAALAIQVALGLVFDPRYRDFPFAGLTAATAPYLVLSFAASGPFGKRGAAEMVSAASLVACAVYIALNESLANWQALWFCAVLACLAAILLRSRVAPG
jgi:exo-beta-1,3-glucanase (GH17 family)